MPSIVARWGKKTYPAPDPDSSSAKDDLEEGKIEFPSRPQTLAVASILPSPSDQPKPEPTTPPKAPTPSPTAPSVARASAAVPSAFPEPVGPAPPAAQASILPSPSDQPKPAPTTPPKAPTPSRPTAPAVPEVPSAETVGPAPPAAQASILPSPSDQPKPEPTTPPKAPTPSRPTAPSVARAPAAVPSAFPEPAPPAAQSTEALQPSAGPDPPPAGVPSGPPHPGAAALSSAARRLSSGPAPTSAPASDPSEVGAKPPKEVKEVKHGECIINGQVKKYAYLPPAAKVTKFDIQRLLAVWKLPLPNLVMQLNSHDTPSSQLVSKEMLETVPEFQNLKTDLGKPDLSLEEANKFVENQAESILGAVGVALSMSDSFILLKGKPVANHYMLGRALERSKASPPIIAVDDLQPYFQDLKVDPTISKEWKGIGRTLEKWGEEMTENAVSLNQPRLGSRAEIDIRSTTKLKDYPFKRLHPGKMDNHVVACTPWTSATHYIWMHHDFEHFNPSLLGNHGLMVLGGDGGEVSGFGKELREALERGDPTILVNNTGGETQQYARLLKRIWEYQKKGENLLPHAQDLLMHALKGITNSATTKEPKEPVFGGYFVDKLNLPEVLRIINMVRDRPKYFQETLKIVDVLKDSPEHVIKEASKSFASRATHACELGAGRADEKAINCAWQVHVALIRLGGRLRRWDHFVICFTALVTFLGSASSVLVTWAKSVDAPVEFCQTATCAAWLGRAAVTFPALATALIAFVAATRFTSRVAHLKSLAGRVVAEIYKFRMRVGVYDLLGMRSSVSDPLEHLEEEQAKQNVSVLLHESRTHFSTTIRNMVEETAKRMAGGFNIDSHDALTVHQLQPHVNRSCYGTSEYSAKGDLTSNLCYDSFYHCFTGIKKSNSDPQTSEYSATANDDLTSNLSCDSYYHFRILPLLAFYRRQTPWLARIDLALNAMLMLLTTLATVLAAMDQALFVPLVFAAAGLLKSLQEYGAFNARLVATTNAVAELTSLELLWESLSEVDKGLSTTRYDLVSVAERAALGVLVAETGEAQFFEGERMQLPAGKESNSNKKPEAKQDKAG